MCLHKTREWLLKARSTNCIATDPHSTTTFHREKTDFHPLQKTAGTRRRASIPMLHTPRHTYTHTTCTLMYAHTHTHAYIYHTHIHAHTPIPRQSLLGLKFPLTNHIISHSVLTESHDQTSNQQMSHGAYTRLWELLGKLLSQKLPISSCLPDRKYCKGPSCMNSNSSKDKQIISSIVTAFKHKKQTARWKWCVNILSGKSLSYPQLQRKTSPRGN